tara:strand:+ start:416 stop:541 length:126 start_codon:yes stop_codon:yes gene_type:complete
MAKKKKDKTVKVSQITKPVIKKSNEPIIPSLTMDEDSLSAD